MSARLTRRLASTVLTPVAAAALVGLFLPGTAAAAQVVVPNNVTFEQWRLQGTDSWTTGNLGSGYTEGQVVPFRLTVTNAGNSGAGDTFVFSICRDFQSPDSVAPERYGYLLIDEYDTTVSPDLEGATPGNTINGVTGAGDGATVTIVSVTDDNTPAGGDCGSDQRETEVELTVAGLNGSDQAYVLWGGHLASPFDAGVAPLDGASTYPGSSLQMTFFPSKTLSANGGNIAAAPAGTLTVNKAVNNAFGGTLTAADFPLFINGSPVTSGVANPLPAGDYTVSETQQPGYGGGAITGACAPDGTVRLGDGENLTCTITNNDVAPTLTVIKHVVNDHDGTLDAADFTMHVAGTDVSDASFPGSETGTSVTLDAGVYSVTESGPAGYTASYSAGCTGTIALGESRTCTITNDDVDPDPDPAQLTVTKVVVNDDGGTAAVGDFDLFVDETEVTSGVGVSLPAGAYTVNEGDHAGYVGTITGDCAADGSITLAAGEVASCTITNDDVTPDPDPDPDPDPEPDPDPDPQPQDDPDPDPQPQDDPDPEPDSDPDVESSSDTTQDNQPLQSVPVSTPPLVISPAAAENSPAAATELPRTGAGLRDEALLGFALTALGLLSRTLGRRRTNTSMI